MNNHCLVRTDAGAKPDIALCLNIVHTGSIPLMMNYLFKTILITAWATLLSRVTYATKASLVQDSCEYNTYMCCWTKNDNGVEDNTDVCE